MNILYTLNDKFVPQVAASICSICENNKDVEQINFYIISNGITDENKEKLKNFIEGYDRKIYINELKSLDKYIDFAFDTTGWNQVVLARLLLVHFLPQNIDKILYLDGDTIVRNSLNDLWNINLDEYVIGASIEPTVDKKRKMKLGLEFKPYYNSGVLLINLKKWKELDIENIILEYCKKNQDKIFAPDQDAINGAISDFIYKLPPKYNFFNIFYYYPYTFLCKLMNPVEYFNKDCYEESIKSPVIIHYLGEERPWRIGNSHKYKNDYINYLGKTPWKDCGYENGWKIYFFFWNIFNSITKPFPGLRYKVINSLIPTFMKIRAKKVKKTN